MFQILVDIAANTAKLETGLDKAAKKLGDFETTVVRTGKTLASAFGVGLGLDALVSSMKRAIDTGAGLELLAQRFGTSAKSLSQLQYAAQITDVPIEALSVALDHFHEVTTRAEIGGGRAAKTFAAIGVDAKKLLELPFDKQLSAIADKLAAIQNPAQRAGIEMVLFGETGAKLDPLLRQGSAGIERLRAAAEAAGVTFDDKMGPALLRTKESLEQAQAQITAASERFTVALAPAIVWATGKLSEFITDVERGKNALAELAGGAAPGANALGQLEGALRSLQETHERLVIEISEAEAEKDPQTGALAGIMNISDADLAKKKALAAEYVRLIANMQQQIREQITAAQKAGTGKPGAPIDIAPPFDVDKLLIKIDAQKIYQEKMKALLDEYNKNTETSVERTVNAYYNEEAELNELRGQGLVDQEEYQARLKEILDKYLPGIEVTGKIKELPKETEASFDDMQKLGDKAATSLQGAFANFLFNPFHQGAKRMGLDFLEALHKMTADAAAAKIFKALFGEGDGGGKKGGFTGSGLGGLFGGALDKLFEGGAQSTGGGPNLAQRALGSASGAIGGGIGKWIAGLFGGGGGGGGGAGAGAGGGVGDFPGELPGLAEGGLVSAGSSYMVGEEGPELFTAASHGMITPNDALGGDTHIHMGDTHIDARGADADRVMQMVPPLIASANAQMAAKMLIAFRRNGLAAPPRV